MPPDYFMHHFKVQKVLYSCMQAEFCVFTNVELQLQTIGIAYINADSKL